MYTKEFMLHGGDAAFANRHKALFERLSMAEKECNKDKDSVNASFIDTETSSEEIRHGQSTRRNGKRETRRLRGKESIFKRPEGPAPRSLSRNISNHHRYPHKWIKYSLDDVSNEDMSDKSNTRAALSFLRELKARNAKRAAIEEKMHVDEANGDGIDAFDAPKRKSAVQIQFRKPEREAENMEEPAVVVIEKNDKPIFKSSKIMMPEYIVGQRQKKKDKRNKPIAKVDRRKELKLDHLNEPDEAEI